MPQSGGERMLADITSQPESLQALVDGFSSQASYLDQPTLRACFQGGLVFTGCGTTYALGLSAAALYRGQGFAATALPASEISFYPEALPADAAALVAFSRSGETSETLWAVDAFRRQRPQARVMAITASPHSSLAKSADWVLDAAPASDRSVIETRSFTGMLLLAQACAAWLAGDRAGLERLESIPGHMSRIVAGMKPAAESTASQAGLERFFFLGSGALYGAACQAAFTMKECCADWAEAFHPLEFRHGPRTAAIRGALVCLFLADHDQRDHERRVLREMQDQGVSTLVIMENDPGSGLDLPGTEAIYLESGLPLAERIVLYLPFAQWLAYWRALALGKDPDHPANLHAVTRL